MSGTRSDSEIEENTLLSSVLSKFNKVYIIDKFIETPPEKHKSVSRNSKPYVIQQAIETLRKKFCDLDDLILHLHLLCIRSQKLKKQWSILGIQNARRLAKVNLTSEKIDASFKKYFTKRQIKCSVRSEITGDYVSTVLCLGSVRSEPLFCLANKQLSLIFVYNLNIRKTDETSFILKGIKKTFKGSDINVLTRFYTNAHEIYNLRREKWETLQKKLLGGSVNKRTTKRKGKAQTFERFINAKDDTISRESEDNEHNQNIEKTSHDVMKDLCAHTDTHPGPSECCQTELEEENNEQCAKTKTRSPSKRLYKNKNNENLKSSKQHYPSIDETIVPNKRCKEVLEQKPQPYNQRPKRYSRRLKDIKNVDDDRCKSHKPQSDGAESLQIQNVGHLEINEQYFEETVKSPYKKPLECIKEKTLKNSKHHHVETSIVLNDRCKKNSKKHSNLTAEEITKRLEELSNKQRILLSKIRSDEADSQQIESLGDFENDEQYVKTKSKSPTERAKEHENVSSLKNNRHSGSIGKNMRCKKHLEMKRKIRKVNAFKAKSSNKKLTEAQNEETRKEEEFENNVSFFNSKEISPNKRPKEHEDVESLKNNELYHCVETSIVPNKKTKKTPKDHSQHDSQRANVCKEIQSIIFANPVVKLVKMTHHNPGMPSDKSESQQIEGQGDFENIVTTKSKSPTKRPKKHENVACLKNNKPCDSNIVPNKKRKEIKQKHIQSGCERAEEHNRRSKKLQNEDNFLHTEPSIHSYGANRKCEENRNKNDFQCADPGTTSNIQESEQNDEERHSEMVKLPVITELNYTTVIRNTQKSTLILGTTFKGENILKGLDELIQHRIADAPLPDYLYLEPRTGKTEFILYKNKKK